MKQPTIPFRISLIAALTLASIPTGIFIGAGASAHEAPVSVKQPLGWQYGLSCCSSFDCRPLASGDVSETPQGYVIKLTGETIPYGDKRLKQSKDEFYHQCTKGGDPKAPHSICLYTPDRGF